MRCWCATSLASTPPVKAMAVAQPVEVGMRLTFCQRNAAAARADLTRICAEIREALEPEEMTADLAGALNADTAIPTHTLPAAWRVRFM